MGRLGRFSGLRSSRLLFHIVVPFVEGHLSKSETTRATLERPLKTIWKPGFIVDYYVANRKTAKSSSSSLCHMDLASTDLHRIYRPEVFSFCRDKWLPTETHDKEGKINSFFLLTLGKLLGGHGWRSC